MFATYRSIVAPLRFCTDGGYRSVLWLRLLRSQELHQTTALTEMDRYRQIFTVAQDYFAGKPDLRILSYGCSTGEEVLTLRSYFPDAVITGVEINRHSLAKARKQAGDGMVFLEALPAKPGDQDHFDAIFCMAVLQRTPMRIVQEKITNLTGIYPFEKFDHKVTELDAWLKRDGLFILRHSQYRFPDASAASRYAPLAAADHIRDTGPKFDRTSRRLEDEVLPPTVFIKVRD
ncbi:MAG TPA: methyltransferase domain-containing protein [Bryobacteraceae bacterium]